MKHLYAYIGLPFRIVLCLYIVAENVFAISTRLCSVFFIINGMNSLTFLSFVFLFRQLGVLPYWVSYVGNSLIIIGMVIRFSAIIQLGRFFSHAVGVVANQELIESGLYRWIRNPSYTGGWLIAIGYTYRIHVEEKVMIQQFKDKYLDYINTTKKMFPGIW